MKRHIITVTILGLALTGCVASEAELAEKWTPRVKPTLESIAPGWGARVVSSDVFYRDVLVVGTVYQLGDTISGGSMCRALAADFRTVHPKPSSIQIRARDGMENLATCTP